jgi:MoaA/NifB/PqqE/SkfB family radical SAM enzyme
MAATGDRAVRDRNDPQRLARLAGREEAAHEARQWVRLTRCCNNRCVFCLDSEIHDGSRIPEGEIRGRIIDGRRRGATRLILSGGEPTIHPGFTDFVRLGRDLGYEKVQVITNGRMFSYTGFLGKCVEAGLGEITFSIHGPDASIHDRLVGVEGAFEQAMKGLRAALSGGRLVVNVDVCLNRINVPRLPELLERFIALGVREFDLLQLVPFGRAHDSGAGDLFYDVDEAMPAIEAALRISESPGVTIWFNRFPPPFLENYEHLIQDPHKLEDEIRGRQDEFEIMLADGTPLSCRQPDRCRRCYLQPFCDDLEETRRRLMNGDFEFVRVDAGRPLAPLPASTRKTPGAWICAADARAAAAAAPGLPGRDLVLELDDYSELRHRVDGNEVFGKRLLRAHTSKPVDLDRLLSIPGSFEVAAALTREMAGHILSTYPDPPGRLVVGGVNHDRLTEALHRDADLPRFFARYSCDVIAQNVPPCIGGRHARPAPRVLDAMALDRDGKLDIFGHLRSYVRHRYYTHSRRCRSCACFERCPGIHINFARAHGYGTLRPLGGSSGRC